MTLLLASLLLAYLLTVWYESSAVAEYGKMLGLGERLKIDEYLETASTNPWSYPDFLNEYHSNKFVVRVLRCPVCLSTWLSIPCCLIMSAPIFPQNFAVAFIGLTLYYSTKVIQRHGQRD